MLTSESPQGTTQSWDQPRELAALTAILAVYLLLAFYGIGRQSLWEDEYYSVWRVTASVHPIWKDGHGFLYFLLLYLWMGLGDSEIALRSLSVALGACAVCSIYFLACRLMNRRAAVVGALIFATSPFMVWYSQEARYITLVLLTSILSTLALQRLFIRQSLMAWLVYGASTLLAVFSFVLAWFLPLAQGLYLLASPSRRMLFRKWAVCQVLVFSLFALWFVNGTHFLRAIADARQSGEQIRENPKIFPFSGDFNQIRVAMIPYTIFALSAGFSLGPAPRELYADRSFRPIAPYVPLLSLLAALYGGLLLAGLTSLRLWPDTRALLLLWFVMPLLGVFAIAWALDVFFDVRYVSMIFPAYALLLAAGVTHFRRTVVQLALLVAVLGVHAVALANYYFDPRYAREDTRSAAQFLTSNVGPGDAVLVVGTLSSLPYYYSGNPPLTDFHVSDGGGRSLSERLGEIGANHKHVWLVQIRPWQTDREGKVKALLENAFSVIVQEQFPGVEVLAYRASHQ